MKRFTKYIFTFLLCLTACSFVACGKNKDTGDNYDPVHIVSMDYSNDDYLSGSKPTLNLYLSDEDNNSHLFVYTMQPNNEEGPTWKDLSVTYDSNVVSVKDGVVTAKGVGETTITIKARKGQFSEDVNSLQVNVKVTNPYFYAGGTYYNNANDFTTAVGSSSSVKLLRDVKVVDAVTVNKKFTLDLNNHKLTMDYNLGLTTGYTYNIKNGQITSSKSVISNDGTLELENVTLTTTGDQTTVVNKGTLTANDSTITSQNGVAVLIDSTNTSYIGCSSSSNANTGLNLNGKPALKVVQGTVYVGNPTINNGNQNNQVLILTNTREGNLSFKVNTYTTLKVKVESATENFKEQNVSIENNNNAIFDYGTINLSFNGQVSNTLALTLKRKDTNGDIITIRPKTPVNFPGKMVFEFNNNGNFQFQDLNGDVITPTETTGGSYDSKIELTNANGIMMTWGAGTDDQCPDEFVILANYVEDGKQTQQVVITVTIDTSENN